MNPLSAWIFTLRHKGRAALLLGLIGLATAGLYLMVALIGAIFIEPMRSNRLFLSKFSVVMPAYYEGQADPTVLAQVRANPDVAEVIPVGFGVGIGLPEVIGGGSSRLQLLAVMEGDLPGLMEQCGATLKQGQLLQPRTNGILLSEQVAASLDLQVGDTIHCSTDSERYGQILDPMEVIGILESDVRMGIVSFEFLTSHELYRDLPLRFLVVGQEGREGAVDDFLRKEIHTTRTQVWTLQWLNEVMTQEYLSAYLLLIPIIAVVAIAMALVVGVINRMANARRLPEFGLLHAIGHSRAWLTRRLTREAAVLALAGWGIGIGLAWLALCLLKLAVFAPGGHDLSVITLAPVVLVVLVPLAVIGFTLVSVRRTFSRLDAIAVVERGELSLEEERRPAVAPKSSSKPLMPLTFYRRHKRRAVLSIGAMALMIIAVALVVFLFTATGDAQRAQWEKLRRATIVAARPGLQLDPGVVAQIRAHPAVERVIVAHPFTMIRVIIPPLGGTNINPFGVYADDMTYLVALYGLQLKEGHLPRPRSNEVVLPETVAQNHNLKVGDVIGDPEHPVHPDAPHLPTPFVISGIFARPAAAEEENWLAFVSLEFLQSHEMFGNSTGELLVVPREGQKETLDDWLENGLLGAGVSVRTYRTTVAAVQKETRSTILTMVLIESVVAAVAALSLAVLQYISVSQRRSEFGLLHALGYGRARLVWRAVGETGAVTGAAWGLSALLFLGGQLYLQFGVFAPVGLRLDFVNVTPWLFTLPIPVAVLLVTTGTIARTLSKLDPVSIIERR